MAESQTEDEQIDRCFSQVCSCVRSESGSGVYPFIWKHWSSNLSTTSAFTTDWQAFHYTSSLSHELKTNFILHTQIAMHECTDTRALGRFSISALRCTWAQLTVKYCRAFWSTLTAGNQGTWSLVHRILL